MATEPTTPNETVVLRDVGSIRDYLRGVIDPRGAIVAAFDDIPSNVHVEAELVLRWRCPGVAPEPEAGPRAATYTDGTPRAITHDPVANAHHDELDRRAGVVAPADAETETVTDGTGRIVAQVRADEWLDVEQLNEAARFLYNHAARAARTLAIDEERARAAAEHRRALLDLARRLLDLAAAADTENDALRFADMARVTLGRTPGEHLVRDLIASVDAALGREQFARPTGTLNRGALGEARDRAALLLASLGGYR